MYVDLTPTAEGFASMKLAFQQSIHSYEHDIQEIDNYIAENELPYLVESALYVGQDKLLEHIEKLQESVDELERCGY